MIDLRNKKVLITGAQGFLGKHLVKNLLEKRKVPRENLFLPTFEELDLRKWENCQKAVKGQNIVIHLAAKVGGIGLNKEIPGEMFYDNAVMGIQLMEAARLAGVEKFVALGTICLYPKFTPVPFKEDDLWNGYPEETNAPYGLAKKMMMVQAQAYRVQYGFNAIFVIPTNLYGPGDNFDPESSHVIPAIIRKIQDAMGKGETKVSLWGTGGATRDFLYVDDAAEGICLALEEYNGLEPINLGSGKEISILDLVEKICQLMGYKGELVFDRTTPDGQPRRCLNIERAWTCLGWEPKVGLEDGLRDTIEYWRHRAKK